MTAISGSDRNTKLRKQRLRNFPSMAAAVLLYEGAMAARDSSGYMRPARATNTDTVMGVCRKRADNSAGSAGTFAGGVEVDPEAIACFGNSANADAITAAHIGLSCYVVDDQTVALTDNGGARPRAGKIHDVTTDGVWVDFNARPCFAVVKVSITDVSALSNSTTEPAPFSGFIRRVYSKLGGAITAADSTVTPKIGSTNITGAALTIANAGSAAGDIDFAHPTAANFVNAGDLLIAATDGASSTTATLDVFFLIEVPV
jgi:hypothetical protein